MWLFHLIPLAAAFDPAHPALARVLASCAGDAGVDYAALQADRADLDAYVAELAAADPAGMDPPERAAFWINAYNALTLRLIAEHYPLRSIRDLDGGNPWDARTFQVGGQQLTLNQIEHQILRPLGDPRIHAAINCASRGCPPLSARPFTGPTLEAELDAASARWVQGGALTVDVGANTVSFSALFDWFGEDFLPRYGASLRDIPGLSGKEEAAVNFALVYLEGDRAAWLAAGGYATSYSEYDWSLNAK